MSTPRRRDCSACRKGQCAECSRWSSKGTWCEHICPPPSGQLLLPWVTDGVEDSVPEHTERR